MNTSFSRCGRASASALLTAALLAACGGGGDSPPAVVAGADTVTVAQGQSTSLLGNDSLGGAAVSIATNVTFSVVTSPLPAGITLVNGTLSVGNTAAPGTTTLSYKLCETQNPTNCATGTVTLTVPPQPIVATADTVTLASGASADALSNDTLAGVAATAATVSATATGTLPTGVALSAAGVLTVATGATPGSYAIAYQICQKTVTTNCASSTINLTIPAVGAMTGRAVDASTGAGIAGVKVTVAGVSGISATTDTSGSFSLPNLPPMARASVVFDSANYAQSARIASVSTGATIDVQVRMLPVGISSAVDVATGGTVTVPGSSARVVLPAAGVQRADGSIPTGNMTVRLTAINPATDSAVMPGDFTALQAGSAVPIESFGAINVQLSDSAGAPLNLRTGQTATIQIPVASRSSSVPSTIPLFFYDTAAGRWVQEGSATLSTGGPYYVGTVGHFSTWNADQIYNTVRVTGCLTDAAGTRLAGAFVQADGIDYSGTSSTVTANDGSFVLPMRVSSLATVVGLSGGRLTNTVRLGPYAADTTVDTCLVLGQAGAGVTMKLTWGATPRDLDSHLFAPNGTEVYFSNKGSLLSLPFANLDVDDTSSYGPEVVTLTKLMVGTYKYSIYNYSGQGSGTIGAAGARVELNLPGRSIELYAPPTTGESTSTPWWNLFELDVDAACGITVRRVDAFASTKPAASPFNSSPQFCTAP